MRKPISRLWPAAYPTHIRKDYVINSKIAPLANMPRTTPVGGCYSLLQEGRLVGCIGVSGGNYQQDQDAAFAALRRVGFVVAGA